MDPEVVYSCVAIVPAAGSGSRLRSVTADSPKLLFKLDTLEGEKSLLAITVKKLIASKVFAGVVVACSSEHLDDCKKELKEFSNSEIFIDFVIGGDTRQNSVYRALEYLSEREPTHVAIHDAARPFVSIEALKDVVQEGRRSGAAILVERVTSTLKRVNGENQILETYPRTEFTLAQTPQVFDFNLILNAHREAIKVGFDATDDSQLVERLGIKPMAVINQSLNPKITEPSDLELARLLASNKCN